MQRYSNVWRWLPPVSALLVIASGGTPVGTVAMAEPAQPPGKVRAQSPRPAKAGGFERFRHEEDGWKILGDASVKKLIRETMGNQDEKFWSCAQLTDVPIVTGDEILIVASVRGLHPFMQAILSLNIANGSCTAGYLTDEKLHVFGAKSEAELPRSLKDYLKRYGRENAMPALTFEKPDWRPVKTVTSPAPKKNLNLAVVTGTYRREGSSHFDEATLTVKALPASKVSFQIEASSGGNTGEAEATVPMVNHQAVYKEDTSELRLQFKGKQVVVTGDDSFFCGAGVTLLGTYTKIDDSVPAAGR